MQRFKRILTDTNNSSKAKFFGIAYLVLLITFIIVIAFLLFTKYPILLTVFTDQPKIRDFISQFGIKAPFILIGLQVLQIIFAPIPGHLIGFIAGYLFGVLKGTVFCLIGIFIGASITFWLSRFFGRRLLKLFISKENLEKFDLYVVRKGPFVIFTLLLIPFSPLGDIIYYLSGLTAIPYFVYVVLVIIARLPNNLVNNLIGAKAFNFTLKEWVIFFCGNCYLSGIFLS
ncbi:MAG: VTT domain-containing protein [candidate division WOR-3 bacterium]|nr:VTT domain-containing protein [candidate division WOR-3 bacterium]